MRPSRDTILMETAALWASRSTCSRLHVGCVIGRDSRILATGYNGAPAGMPHCDHECNCAAVIDPMQTGTHEQGCSAGEPCWISVHAEANAIAYAARHGIALEGAFLYTTHMPCLNCCMLIVNAGIAAVVWKEDYRDTAGIELLKAGNIGHGKYRPAASADDRIDERAD